MPPHTDGPESSATGFDRAAARRCCIARAPFGLDMHEVELPDGEFAPRQGAALVAIERRQRAEDRRHPLKLRALCRLGLKRPIRQRAFDKKLAVGEHASQIDLRLGDASRRFLDIGVGAFAGDPLREGFDVARQTGSSQIGTLKP